MSSLGVGWETRSWRAVTGLPSISDSRFVFSCTILGAPRRSGFEVIRMISFEL